MKKRDILPALAFFAAMLWSCSVSFPNPTPTSGIYFCEELGISIDFSISAEHSSDSAVLHTAEGDCKNIRFYTDYGYTACFFNPETSEYAVTGKYSWHKSEDAFYIEEYSTGTTYRFSLVGPSETVCQYCNMKTPWRIGAAAPINVLL